MWNTNERTARTGDTLAGEAFLCCHCKTTVPGMAPGTQHRNHCPACLWSMHVDLRTGDRRSGCRGAMEPVGIAVRADGEWSLVHRCTGCGFIRMNRIAGDDNAVALVSMALRPLGRPPFPLERLAEMLPAQEGGTV